MKILGMEKGQARLKSENLDDLWYLSQVIDPGDKVSAKTTRKIKIGDDDRATKVIKKVRLTINVIKVEFHKYSDQLRVLGKITDGPDDVPRGTHHTIAIEPGTEFKLIKERFLKYQIDKLKEASKSKPANVLICTFDREEAYFAMLTKQGYRMLSQLKGNVAKKNVEVKSENFYKEIIKVLDQYKERHKPQKIILASPAFWKDELLKQMPDRKGIITATCNSIGKNAIDEVLKRPEVDQALREDRVSRELKLVEDLLTAIKTDGAFIYGLDETLEAASQGAVKILLVTDNRIHEQREKEDYQRLDAAMRTVDSGKGEIHIISSEYDGGKKLDGLGGIGALLHYKL